MPRSVRYWFTLDYLLPFYLLRAEKLAGAPVWFLPAFVLWTLPFLWIGVAMTLRRAIDAGRSPWLALVFFVPLFNYIVMLALCRLPTVPLSPREERAGGRTVDARVAAGVRRHRAGGELESRAPGRRAAALRARGPRLRRARAAPGARAGAAGRGLRPGDRAPHAGPGRAPRQPGARDSRACGGGRGARPESAVRGRGHGRGRRAPGGGVAQRGELQRAPPAYRGAVPARYRLPDPRPNRRRGRGRHPSLRILYGDVRRADQRLGSADPLVVRHHGAACAVARAVPLWVDRTAPPARLLPGHARRVPVDGAAGGPHPPGRRYVVRARYRSPGVLEGSGGRDRVGDPPARPLAHQATDGGRLMKRSLVRVLIAAALLATPLAYSGAAGQA